MKMQDFMQKIKEKKLKRSDWLILVLAGNYKQMKGERGISI